MTPVTIGGQGDPANATERPQSHRTVPVLVVARAPAHRRSHPWPRPAGLPLHALSSDRAGVLAPRIQPPARRRPRPTRTDPSSAVRLDQYYTRPGFAARCYRIVCSLYNTAGFLMVEPSAGKGVFARMLPSGSLAYDLEPKHPLVQQGDFFEAAIPHDRHVMMIGNPPFGRGSRMAVRFFNHAARSASVIAMILPRTFRKASIENRLDQAFHLVLEEPAPRNAFEFQGMECDVPAVFQIWERRDVSRTLRTVEKKHPDFRFVKPALAGFAIRRIGVNAGRIGPVEGASESSHHFVRGDVEAVMRELDLAGAAANTAGIPSLAKSEIVALYRQHVERRAA